MKIPDSIKVLVLVAWLCLPSMAVLSTDLVQGGAEGLAVLAFSIFIWACPLVLLPKLKQYLLLCTPLALLILPYAYMTVVYNSVPGDALVSASIHSDSAHALDVLRGFGWKLALIPVSALAYFMLARSISSPLHLSMARRKGLLAFLLLYAMSGMFVRQTLAKSVKMPALFEEYTANLSFPSNFVLSLQRVLRQHGAQSDLASVRGRAAGASAPLLVVLVIGESVRSDHLGINGYARATTPKLAAMGQALITFPDVASTANWTYAAVPNIVSRPVRRERASLVGTFKEAGFMTAWLSNQEPALYNGGADVSEFSDSEMDRHLRKDSTLLPLFKSFVRQAGPRQFVVLHMNGSHEPYDERYGGDSRIFAPTLSDIGVGFPHLEHKAEAINSYDNSIVELDTFLAQVIRALDAEARPAIVLFTSDHGENLFDDRRGLFMHAGSVATRADTHVPMLAWMNRPYLTQYPALAAALRANAGKKISHRNIFPSLLELGGIDWDQRAPEDSFASGHFLEKRRMAMSNVDEHDYDTLK
ncbi:MAG: phosphoethanolamine transferase [Pseudomonadota bacterium]